MEKLVDIKDFVEVNDNSIYIFSSLVFFGILIILLIAWKIFLYFKNRKKSQYQIAKEALLNLKFTDSKLTSYKVSKFAPFLVQSEAQRELLKNLLDDLTKYKYKKIVPSMSDEDKNKIKMFLEACDV